jgi:hypothetical protein
MCFRWLKQKFIRSKENNPVMKPDVKPVKFPRVYRLPNMPKYQRCPMCHGWRKRKEKTLGGAKYYCGKCHLLFLVRRA